jgi:hypothetical protein
MSVSVDCTRRESGRQAPPPPGRKPYSSLPDPLRDDPTIPPAAKSLLLILAGFAWGARPACWPSDRTLGAAWAAPSRRCGAGSPGSRGGA